MTDDSGLLQAGSPTTDPEALILRIGFRSAMNLTSN